MGETVGLKSFIFFPSQAKDEKKPFIGMTAEAGIRDPMRGGGFIIRKSLKRRGGASVWE